jgi:molybdopterin-guanine dinucleotide biosynthesis protein A
VTSQRSDVIAGVFVGGRGRRFGGAPKGLLVAPDGRTLLDRWCAVLREAGVQVLLVGRHEAYASLDLETLDDDPAGIGPLGGLVALLKRAARTDGGQALALACDMPFVSTALIDRLIAAPPAAVVAPRRDGHWEPLCARYDATRVLPQALARVTTGRHKLQSLLDELDAVALHAKPGDARELHDWDEPGDAS